VTPSNESDTCRILTGDETASGGVATASGRYLAGDRRAFLQAIGYCPQFDSIVNVLTGAEMLQLMARLRGMHEEDVGDEVDRWINALGTVQLSQIHFKSRETWLSLCV
jgi:ABC-type multidrug transport system ATPase subunit